MSVYFEQLTAQRPAQIARRLLAGIQFADRFGQHRRILKPAHHRQAAMRFDHRLPAVKIIRPGDAVQQQGIDRRAAAGQAAIGQCANVEYAQPRQGQPIAKRRQISASLSGRGTGQVSLDNRQIELPGDADERLPAELPRHQPAIQVPRGGARDGTGCIDFGEARAGKKALKLHAPMIQGVHQAPQGGPIIGSRMN